jgi:NADPH:quinone reductase-like Zn-dependent oxidoreductase
MRAVVYERYGSPDVLELREVETPSIGEREVLVRIRAASLNAGDAHLLRATWLAVRLYQGLVRPKRRVLGHDVSGVVEAVGSEVTRFRPGDEVFGASPDAGTFAELVRVPEETLAPKPSRLTHEQAAAVPTAALTALQGLRDKGHLQAGQDVLVNGASGGVGTFAVQIARALGARVTAVCSARKAEAVRSLGAERVLDYAREDFTRREERYDVVLDLVGDRPLAACRGVLTPDGTYVAVSGHPLRTLWVAVAGGRRSAAFISQPDRVDLETLRELLESGRIRPLVDRVFSLADTAEAFRYHASRAAAGKVVIAVPATSQPPA